MQNFTQYTWVQPAVIFLLIAWGIYRRVKKTIGFQLFSPGRLKVRIAIFTLLGVAILLLGFLHPLSLAYDAAGLAVGAILTKYAIRHTVFEQRKDGWYYRTHLWVQTIVLALFLSRIVYRMMFFFSVSRDASAPASPDTFTKDPLTAGVLFVLVSYYVGYFIYIIRQGTQLQAGPSTDSSMNG